MFQKILIPLDGSTLAECALPYAEKLAKGCETEEIILVSVTERLKGRTDSPEARELYRSSDRTDVQGAPSGVMVTFGKMEKQAQRYLSRLAKALTSRGLKARAEVLLGNPAEEIADYAKNNNIAMIVMSSHGRTGPSRWTHGNVAEKVFRSSCVPVLMVRAPGCTPGI